MSHDKVTCPYIFVIDTEEYAGNFERPMCAYITGQVGECGVGEAEADIYKREVKGKKSLFRNVSHQQDAWADYQCARPCAIWPTPGWFNHGVGGHFREGQEAEALIDYRKKVEAYNKPYIAQTEDHKAKALAGKQVLNWTIKACDEDIKRHKQAIAAANRLKKVRKHPAYLSVAIFFDAKPTDEEIKVMKTRANKFLGVYRPGQTNNVATLHITGFRLIERDVKVTETTIEL